MSQVVPRTVGEALYWSYAQMAMAAAWRHGGDEYRQIDYIVRSKTYYGLLRGKLQLGSFYRDERQKALGDPQCAYCGATELLSLDHLIPRLRGGEDDANNLVPACRSCNSSKCGRDLLEWTLRRGEWPPLALLRRYLKLAIRHCVRHDLMGVSLVAAAKLDPPLPFDLSLMPHELPPPVSLIGQGDEGNNDD